MHSENPIPRHIHTHTEKLTPLNLQNKYARSQKVNFQTVTHTEHKIIPLYFISDSFKTPDTVKNLKCIT